MGPSSDLVQRRFGDGGRSLTDVGESALLEALVEIARRAASGPAQGIRHDADDAAVWRPPSGCDLATSMDALVEGIDFAREWITPHQLGRRAFAVAASDLAASGAEPLQCLATLCARAGEGVDDLLAIQAGLCDAAAEWGATVSGGDLSAIDGPLVVDVCITGKLPAGRALRRDRGRPGDLLLVTGTLGSAAAGLRLLMAGRAPFDEAEVAWIAAQLSPTARIAEGRQLLDSGVDCAGDLSDGLGVDVARTAAASSCGAELWADALPVGARLPERFPDDWLDLAVGGGEDFELLAAIAAERMGDLLASWPSGLQQLTPVGRLVPGQGVRVLDHCGGVQLPQPATLSRHFA